MIPDIISDVLRAVRLKGAIFFDVDARAPWAAEAPPSAELASLVLPGAQRVIEYHVVTAGACWARILGEPCEPVSLATGDIVVFPQGHPHVLSSDPTLRAQRPDLTPYHRPVRLPFKLEPDGGGDLQIALICGFLGCDAKPFNPLIEALPKILHVADGYSGDGWLGQLIQATVQESQTQRLGVASVLPKLSELMFIEVVRRYMESLPAEATGWLAALRDPHVGRAIQLLHGEPARDWNLAELGKAVGASRSLLAERFTERVGTAPMTYLQNWRMQLAAGMLAQGATNIARIAAAVGYESEAAFSRAFKRCAGLSPAAWRANSQAALTPVALPEAPGSALGSST
jgi:AraC-like DNA-binding protein